MLTRVLTTATLVLCIAAHVSAATGPKPTYYEGFAKGKVAGPVGKAGTRLRFDGRGVVNMDRGTVAFFYQSKTGPKETEWGGMGGLRTDRDAGYWSMAMGFQVRRRDFLFALYDVGFYSPPLRFPNIFGRWKAGQWHHLAAVWDRNEGMTIYEDGRRVNSNWGKYRWEWNVLPARFSLNGPLDEVYVFAECLTDAQVAQLAKGRKPTGAPIPIAPSAKRRRNDMARMGWVGESLANMPTLSPDAPRAFAFARINHCVDAKRPVAYPYEGLLRSAWPSGKYGPSIRGQRLEISLDPNQSYDRVRLFVHRPFKAQLVGTKDGTDRTIASFDVPRAMFWHQRLPRAIRDTALALKRARGRLGQIDFYRVEPLSPALRPKLTETFTFAPAKSFPETDQAKIVMAETPRRFWQPLVGARIPAAAWALRAPAFGGFQAVTESPKDAKAYDGALVTLVAEGIAEPTPVRVEIKEPVDAERVWLAVDAVLRPKGRGRQTYTMLLKGRPVVNLPEMRKRKYWKDGKYLDELLPVPGVGFTIEVAAANPVTWIMGRGGASVAFSLADMNTALPAAADDQVEWMREAYAEAMEGHAYKWRRLQLPLTWLAKFAPERMETRQMYERVGSPLLFVGIAVPKLVYEPPKNTTGAPEWAFRQKVVMDLHRKHVHWIIDNKQVWTGEFGGVWNDDSTHVENWIGYMLCIDGEGKIKDAMRRYWDGVWAYQLVEGVGKYTQDTCHYSEEGSSGVGMRLLVDYGDPVAYARTMTSASHFDKWLTKDNDGGYLFKSVWVGPEGAWTEGAFMIDKKRFGHCYDIVVPAGYLIWYNRHPAAAQYIRGLEPTGHGLLGPAYDRLTDWNAALRRYAEESVKPVGRRGPGLQESAIQELGLTDAIRKAQKVTYKPAKPIRHYWGSKDTDKHWFHWKVTGDIRFLTDSYIRVAEWFYSHDWLNSAAMPSMDRCPLPRGSLIRSRIGALAANRGSSGVMWPRYAISYAKGADEVAALVTENAPNRFAVRLYPFTDKPHDVQVRAWRCNGAFDVTLAADANDDGKPDKTLWQKRMKLDRGAAIDVTLPPKQPSILSAVPVRVEPAAFDKPDPAISVNTVEWVDGHRLLVRVYNNGVRPVKDVEVRVTRARGGTLGARSTGPIEAPLDLKPRFRAVSFENVDLGRGGVVIEIDPENRIDDLTRLNNRVVLAEPGDLPRPPRPTRPAPPIRIADAKAAGPDPAINLDTVELVYGDHLVVRVYNIGGKRVADALVRATDPRSGELVANGEKHTGPIEAPVNRKPRYRTVEFKNIDCHTYGRVVIEVDPEKKAEDIDRKNNRVALDYRSTFLRNGGWR